MTITKILSKRIKENIVKKKKVNIDMNNRVLHRNSREPVNKNNIIIIAYKLNGRYNLKEEENERKAYIFIFNLFSSKFIGNTVLINII